MQVQLEVLGELAVLLLGELDRLHELADALVAVQRDGGAFLAVAGQVGRQRGQRRQREAAELGKADQLARGARLDELDLPGGHAGALWQALAEHGAIGALELIGVLHAD